jgi:hypothetical protein
MRPRPVVLEDLPAVASVVPENPQAVTRVSPEQTAHAPEGGEMDPRLAQALSRLTSGRRTVKATSNAIDGGAPRGGSLWHLALAIAALIALTAGAVGCGGSEGGSPLGPEPEPPTPSLAADGGIVGADITGPIATASPLNGPEQDDAEPILSFLIEEGRGDYDKASVTATTATRWYRVSDGTLVELDAIPDHATLVGQLVAVAFIGPVAESYPVQARAGWVVLLTAAPTL